MAQEDGHPYFESSARSFYHDAGRLGQVEGDAEHFDFCIVLLQYYVVRYMRRDLGTMRLADNRCEPDLSWDCERKCSACGSPLGQYYYF